MSQQSQENLKFVAGLVLAALVSYFTTVAQVAVLEEREQNHYTELLRGVTETKDAVQKVLDELRRRP